MNALPPTFRELVLIGTGATSRVYRAIDARSGQTVALKRLHRQLVRSSEALARLKRELEALGRLHHPNIVKVKDVIRFEGEPTIVMDYVPGRDLKERLTEEGPLAASEVERIARTLLDILATTHGAGIVHRDIKPQNVRITPDGELFLLDFGSARLDAASQLTQTGSTVGTPDYMAPELFAGSACDPRVDIYGVGATLFECATGRTAQSADSLAELAFQRTKQDAPKVRDKRPDLPEHLAQVIDRCLSRAPEDRYASARLAVWALDHPDAERAFALRRASHPPCLHCGQPLAPEAGVCTRCRTHHPFTYAPGPAHVDIASVSEPEKLIETILLHFPEWAQARGLQALADRCAALSFSKQRYLSNVSVAEAEHVAHTFSEVGVRCDVGTSKSFTQRLWDLVTNGPSILANTRMPKPIAPATMWWSIGGMMLFWMASMFLTPFALPLAVGFTISAFLSANVCFRRAAITAKSPEPSLFEGVERSLMALEPERSAQARPMRAAQAVSLAFALCMLPIVESGALVAVGVFADPVGDGPAFTRVDRTEQVAPTMSANPTRTFQGSTASHGSPSLIRRKLTPAAISAGLGLLPLSLLLLLRRRRRLLHAESERIMRELDRRRLIALGSRPIPDRTRHLDTVESLPDLLAKERLPDAFAQATLTRASDLAHCVPPERTEQLRLLLEQLSDQSREDMAEESLLARCILETDPEQKLRFDLLALEGELEASAAEAWAEKLK